MSAPTAHDRSALAIACLAGTGIVLPWPGAIAGPSVLLAPLAALLLLGLAARSSSGPSSSSSVEHPRVETLALALLLALLLRSLARVLVAVPLVLPGLVLALLVLALLPRRASSLAAPLALFALLAGTGLGGAIERGGPTPRGLADSSPILGVHPRQAVAVTIDGHGPHDLIADDFVEPSGVQGHDPARWAARLESELHRIAELHYAEGPARAREAFAAAEVVLVEPALVPEDAPKLGVVAGLEVRSGTTGEGSSVVFGCAGEVQGDHLGPRTGECPHKYARDGSTGLGLSPRWAGYTELRGRDRLRLARLLGRPSGDPVRDARALALELALLALALLAVIAGLARAGREGVSSLHAWPLLGVPLLGALALLGPARPAAGSETSGILLLAPLLIVGVSHSRGPATASHERGESSPRAITKALPLALVAAIVMLGMSPLAGRAGVVALGEALHEPIVLGLAGSWTIARAGAAVVLVLMLLPGTLACARELAREDRVGRPWLLALSLLLALGLRKPGDDPALLACAVALLLATSLAGARPGPRVGAIALALVAALPLLGSSWLLGASGPGTRDFVGLAMVGGLSLLTLVAGWSSAHRPVER